LARRRLIGSIIVAFIGVVILGDSGLDHASAEKSLNPALDGSLCLRSAISFLRRVCFY
jgi:hypothetical protein